MKRYEALANRTREYELVLEDREASIHDDGWIEYAETVREMREEADRLLANHAGAVEALRYIAGEDVAGFEGHQGYEGLARRTLAKLGVEPYASRGQ
jgi:hypothetical protein